MRNLFYVIISILINVPVGAQQFVKLGHINTQELLSFMPENDTAKLKIEKAGKELQNQYEAMVVEYNKKKQELIDNQKNFSDLIKQTRTDELQQIEQRIQAFSQSVSEDLQSQKDLVYKPILEKLNNVIAEVGKENQFTYIFDTSMGAIVYQSDNSTDILPFVKKKLGIVDKVNIK